MKKFPLQVLKYAVPLILVLAFFSLYSGSTLYFFVSFLFFLLILIVIYPFYENSYQVEQKEEEKHNYASEQEILEKKYEEAKNGNALSQRLIEERVLRSAVEEISDRTGKSLQEILESIEKNSIDMDKNAIEILRKFLERRNSMDKPIDGDEFENEILKVIKILGE